MGHAQRGCGDAIPSSGGFSHPEVRPRIATLGDTGPRIMRTRLQTAGPLRTSYMTLASFLRTPNLLPLQKTGL